MCDQVQCSQFIVLPPTSAVREFLLPSLVLRLRHERMGQASLIPAHLRKRCTHADPTRLAIEVTATSLVITPPHGVIA